MAITYLTEACDFRYKGKIKTREWLRRVAAEEGASIGQLAVVFCSDAYLLGVNREYLHHDYFTDIITFDYSERDKGIVAGDLLISVDTVASNARQYGEEFERELQRVIVHGLLHLLGYGDKSDAEAKTMREKENYYLAKQN